MKNIDLILKDAITYAKMNKDDNYKERLLEAYYVLRKKHIKNLEEFQNTDTGIGAFNYEEITIFDRLVNEDYSRALASFYIELKGLENMPKNFGDLLASYGTIGKIQKRK